MKKLMIALLLLTVAVAASADGEFIGMSFDDQYTVCYGDAAGMVDVHFYAYLGADINAITAAEFRVENYPEVAGAMAVPAWNTDLAIGSPDWGIALAFSPPVAGPYAYLGMITFIVMDPAYFGVDYLMEIMATNDSEVLIVVDENFVTIPVDGGLFTFNCSDPVLCPCYDAGTATLDANWGSVKALY